MDGQRSVNFVRVLNKNTFVIKDRFDGVPYIFGAGKTETIPLAAAEHIFGLRDGAGPDELFHYIVQRQGWNTYKTTDDDARAFVENIVLTPVAAKLVLDTAEEAPISMKPSMIEEHIEQFEPAARRGRPPKALSDSAERSLAAATAAESE